MQMFTLCDTRAVLSDSPRNHYSELAAAPDDDDDDDDVLAGVNSVVTGDALPAASAKARRGIFDDLSGDEWTPDSFVVKRSASFVAPGEDERALGVDLKSKHPLNSCRDFSQITMLLWCFAGVWRRRPPQSRSTLPSQRTKDARNHHGCLDMDPPPLLTS